MIYHLSIAAHHPKHIVCILAELFQEALAFMEPQILKQFFAATASTQQNLSDQ